MKLCNIKNNSNSNLEHVIQLIQHFFPYARQQLGFHKPVMVSFQSDEENANKLLGRTGHYNPDDFSIAIYVDGRHPKDMLRSLSHELVHHAQNCNGDFNSAEELSPGYAQENPAMRNAELDAYKRGNIIFRDFEDLIKKGKIKVNIDFAELGEPKMSLKEWKNRELNTLLMEKWGLAEKQFANDPELDKGVDEGHDHPGDDCEKVHPDKSHKEFMAGLKGQGGGKGDEHYQFDKKEREAELEEGTPAYRDDDSWPWDDDPGENPDLARAYGVGAPEGMSDEEAAMAGHTIGRGGRPGLAVPPEVIAMKKKAPATPEYAGKKVKARSGSRSAALVRGAPRENQEVPRKISAREAKETLTLDEARDLARRIFERISKEIN